MIFGTSTVSRTRIMQKDGTTILKIGISDLLSLHHHNFSNTEPIYTK